VGSVLDTTFFIDLERAARATPGPDPIALAGRSLARALGADEDVAMSAITASELLHGVHRARSQHRARRELFVEAVLGVVPVLPFDLLAARAHARLWAELAAAGLDVGAHDRIVAATALSVGWRVATAHVRHFDRVPGLEIVELHAGP
jgi:tRNA(fMet)-specific endonuclease VapC